MAKKYQHYAMFSHELERYNIPVQCSGPVVYNYWVSGRSCGHIDIDRLIFDLDSGAIKHKRGFGVKTIDLLKRHFSEVDESTTAFFCGQP